MKVIPITCKQANALIGIHHRHNKPTLGGRFAIGIEHDGQLVAAAIIGRPVARMLDAPKVAEVTRLCVTDAAPRNACSFLYASCRRAWIVMGGERLITYTLTTESGASLRGAGWKPIAKVRAAKWTRPSRERGHQDIYEQDKIRWEAAA